MLHTMGLIWLQSTSLLQQALLGQTEELSAADSRLPQLLANLAHAQAAIGPDLGAMGQSRRVPLQDIDLGMHACLDLADWCAAREMQAIRMGGSGSLWREAKQCADLLGGLCLHVAQQRRDGVGPAPSSSTGLAAFQVSGLMAARDPADPTVSRQLSARACQWLQEALQALSRAQSVAGIWVQQDQPSAEMGRAKDGAMPSSAAAAPAGSAHASMGVLSPKVQGHG